MHRGVLPISALTAASVLAGCGGVSQRSYVSRNEALVRSLPVFPGAVKAHEVSTPYVQSEGGLSTKPSGYRTLVLYRVPSGTSGARVLRFYQTQLRRHGWHRVPRALGVVFTRGKELVAMNGFLMSANRRTYDLVVDYRGAGRG